MNQRFDRQEHRHNLISWTDSACVKFDQKDLSGLDLIKIFDWCKQNIGEKRPYHPIYEAQSGWMDYFEGDWAYTDRDPDFFVSFWFAKQDDKTHFQLVWKN